MNLLVSLRSEIFKTKRTATFYLTIIAAAFIPIIFLMDVSVDGMSAENKVNALNNMFREGFTMVSVAIFPMFVALMCTMLPQIEYRNNTWKQVFASPQAMANIFIARFLNVQLLILLFLVLFNVFMGITAVAIHFIVPSAHMLNQPLNWGTLLSFNVNNYIGILAISTIQFWAGLRFRNFIVPIAIGFCLWLVGTMMVMEFKTANAHFFPYTYLIYSTFPQYKPLLPSVQLGSVGYMALFLVLGFVDFRRRKTK